MLWWHWCLQMKWAVGAFTVPTDFLRSLKVSTAQCCAHNSVPGGMCAVSTQITARMQPRPGISIPDANPAITNQICGNGLKHRHLSAHLHHFQKGHRADCYHVYCVERVKLVLYPLKTTFLEDISGQKDKNLPETSKHYFKSTHPVFHTKRRDNLQHWSSHTALLISSLTAGLKLSDGTTWSPLYIPPKQQELAERDKQLHYSSALTQSHVKKKYIWMDVLCNDAQP